MNELLLSLWEWILGFWVTGLEVVQNILTISPEGFAQGQGWTIVMAITDALRGAGYSILVICFYLGVVKSSITFMDLKRPAVAVTMFVRFLTVKVLIDGGTGLVQTMISLGQGLISLVFSAGGLDLDELASMSSELNNAILTADFFTALIVLLISLVAAVVVIYTVFMVILNIYGRFFKIYLAAAISPVPLAFFGGESTQQVGISYIKSLGAVLLEGALAAIACIIYSALAGALTGTSLFGQPGTDTMALLLNYAISVIFQSLLLAGIIGSVDQLSQRMIGG